MRGRPRPYTRLLQRRNAVLSDDDDDDDDIMTAVCHHHHPREIHSCAAVWCVRVVSERREGH